MCEIYEICSWCVIFVSIVSWYVSREAEVCVFLVTVCFLVKCSVVFGVV